MGAIRTVALIPPFFSHICMVQDSWQCKFLWARFCTGLVSLMQYTKRFLRKLNTCRFGQLSVGIFGPNLLDNLFHEGLFTFCIFLWELYCTESYSHSTEICSHQVFCQMWIVMYMGSATLKLLVAT